MVCRNRKLAKSLFFHRIRKRRDQISSGRQLSGLEFDRKLPSGGSAYKYGVVRFRDDLLSRRRERPIFQNPPEQRMCVEQGAQMGLFPVGKLFVRKRFKKLGTDNELSLPGAGLALAFHCTDGNEPRDRLGAARDNDFFPCRGTLDQLGKISLSLMNGDRRQGNPLS